MQVSEGLNLFEELLLVHFLKKLRNIWTYRTHRALAEHCPWPCIEAVFLTDLDGKTHVLLHRRPEDDIDEWKNKFACPGSAVRKSDKPSQNFNGYKAAIIRVKGELGGRRFQISSSLVTSQFFPTQRGPEPALIYVCRLIDQNIPLGFEYFPVDNLPGDIIPFHRIIINHGVKAFVLPGIDYQVV